MKVRQDFLDIQYLGLCVASVGSRSRLHVNYFGLNNSFFSFVIDRFKRRASLNPNSIWVGGKIGLFLPHTYNALLYVPSLPPSRFFLTLFIYIFSLPFFFINGRIAFHSRQLFLFKRKVIVLKFLSQNCFKLLLIPKTVLLINYCFFAHQSESLCLPC